MFIDDIKTAIVQVGDGDLIVNATRTGQDKTGPRQGQDKDKRGSRREVKAGSK